MRIEDLNEAPMGILNRMAQKVVSKVPGSVGAKAQGKLETGQVANQWKKDYMKFLGRTGQKPDTENLKTFLKSLGMKDQDANAIVGESALIERALTGAEIDKIILKAAQKGGGEAMVGGGSSAPSAADASSEPDAAAATGSSAAPGGAAPASTSAAAKPSLAQRAGQAVRGLAGKAASAIGNKLGGAAPQPKVEPTVAMPPPAAGAAPAKAAPAAPAKAAGSNIDSYINNWAKSINAAASPQDKVNLAKEVINFLKDRRGSPEAQRGAAMAKAVLKRSKDPTLQKMAQSGAFALERKLYAAVNTLLEATGLTWRDLGYRIAVTESTAEFVVIVPR